eukprot:84098_1
MSTNCHFKIFGQIDQEFGRYYKSLNKPYFNDNEQGKFLEFCIEEDQNEDDIAEELNDYHNCGYLDFDECFPFDPQSETNMNEEQKRRKIFQMVKEFYHAIQIDDDDSKSDPMSAFEQKIQNLCDDIRYMVMQNISDEIADLTIHELKNMIYEQEYETIDDIKQDIMDTNGSLIIDVVTQNAKLSPHTQAIDTCIKRAIDGKINMNIKNFTWNVRFNNELIETTIQLLKKECHCIFLHPEAPQNGGVRESDDVNLCIAKSIDIENNHPILLWLTDTFGRYRIKKHRQNTQNNVPFPEDDVAVNYDIAKWFENDNPFTKYLANIYPEMSVIIKAAMASLSRRSLPIFNFQHKIFPTICDSLSMFARYTLIFHRFCHQLQVLSTREYPFLPVQFDVLIIPQCVYRKPASLPFELDSDDEEEDDFECKEEMYHQLGKAKHHGEVQNPFWTLQKYLDADGYAKDKDYWMTEIDERLRPAQLQNMWDTNGAGGSDKRYGRYVFIIDRRNPNNMQKEMINKVPFDVHKDTLSQGGWKDTVYCIKPKCHHTITKRNGILPEQLLGLSSEYIFPNPEKKMPDPITILDALNGYKFGLSYHVTSDTNGKCYFYFGHGAVRFYLDDIHWLWPRFFVGNQTVDATICDQINAFKQSNKYFKDADFEQFEKQTYSID